jgi:hypothetical protein
MKYKSKIHNHKPFSQIRHLPHSGWVLGSRFATLTKVPVFILLTIVVHSAILVSAWIFYILEFGQNPRMTSFLDALFWAVATVTTVGYGDIVPITSAGKVLAMLTMIFGSVTLVLYTAFFAGALIAPELNQVESKVKEMDQEVKEFGREIKSDDEMKKEILTQVEALVRSLEKKDRESDRT